MFIEVSLWNAVKDSTSNTSVCFYYLQSDPFVEISKAQEGGVFTVVYRSQPIMKTLDPKFVKYFLVLCYLQCHYAKNHGRYDLISVKTRV